MEAAKQSQDGGIPADLENIDPAEAIRAINQQREQWPSAVFSYETMVRDYISEVSTGRPIDDEKAGLLTSVNSLVGGLHPQLKKQLIDVVERQITLHPESWVLTEKLRCFPHDLFKEILLQTNERGGQISPALVNFLKKMSDIQEISALPDRAADKDFTSKDIETLLKREDYENYVPDDYDRVLKKASETSTSQADSDESRFPLQEYLKTLTYERVDFRICQLLHSLMDEEIAEEDYLACSGKLGRSLPGLLKAGQFVFLTALLETLRRHSHDKPAEQVRQKAQSLLKPLLEKETIARCATPFILEGAGDPAPLTQFLISSGVQNLSWLFDLYLDPKTSPSPMFTAIIKGFGRSATGEALKRLPVQDAPSIIRLLTLIPKWPTGPLRHP